MSGTSDRGGVGEADDGGNPIAGWKDCSLWRASRGINLAIAQCLPRAGTLAIFIARS
jgi:hypothetical protein